MFVRDKILKILKEADGYVSGERISGMLGISRAAVWKHIKALRADGYEILSVTNKGYSLCSEPENILSDRLSAALCTDHIGRNIVYMNKVDSTNEEAKRRADMPDGTLFIAEQQESGKGRLGRLWESPRGGGIWMSLLLRPDIPLGRVSEITLAAGLAVCRAVGCGAMIKWPNDIVIGSRKICGILTEMSAEPDTGTINYVVCGMGINVNIESFPDDLKAKATSLLIETGERHSRDEIAARVLNEFEPVYELLCAEGFGAIREEYARMCVTLGREVRVIYRKNETIGKAADIDENGTLLVDTENGRIPVSSGEVSVCGMYGYA